METSSQLNVKKDIFQVKQKVDEKKIEYLIFSINQKHYALPSSSVEEILRDYQIYNVPFAPDYLKGILNRYGEPYAVVDPAILWGETKQKSDAALSLVIKDSSHTCIEVSDVLEFYSAPESSITLLSDSEISEFVDGILKYKINSKTVSAEHENCSEEVFILNINKILERMGNDFESN